MHEKELRLLEEQWDKVTYIGGAIFWGVLPHERCNTAEVVEQHKLAVFSVLLFELQNNISTENTQKNELELVHRVLHIEYYENTFFF